jgi:hypothetical protein
MPLAPILYEMGCIVMCFEQANRKPHRLGREISRISRFKHLNWAPMVGHVFSAVWRCLGRVRGRGRTLSGAQLRLEMRGSCGAIGRARARPSRRPALV